MRIAMASANENESASPTKSSLQHHAPQRYEKGRNARNLLQRRSSRRDKPSKLTLNPSHALASGEISPMSPTKLLAMTPKTPSKLPLQVRKTRDANRPLEDLKDTLNMRKRLTKENKRLSILPSPNSADAIPQLWRSQSAEQSNTVSVTSFNYQPAFDRVPSSLSRENGGESSGPSVSFSLAEEDELPKWRSRRTRVFSKVLNGLSASRSKARLTSRSDSAVETSDRRRLSGASVFDKRASFNPELASTPRQSFESGRFLDLFQEDWTTCVGDEDPLEEPATPARLARGLLPPTPPSSHGGFQLRTISEAATKSRASSPILRAHVSVLSDVACVGIDAEATIWASIQIRGDLYPPTGTQHVEEMGLHVAVIIDNT